MHQFRRPTGINKWNVFGLFIAFEWFIVLASIGGVFITKNKVWIFSLVLGALFFLFYRDLYYLYLHLLLPFIVLLAVEFVAFLDKKTEELAWGFILLYVFINIYPIITYTNTFAPQGIFENPTEIASALKTAQDNLPIYGVQEVAPLVALLSGRTIFDNKIDTNTQNFAAGTHNRTEISKNAVAHGIYLIARVGEYQKQNIHDTGFEAYFDSEIFKTSCTKFKSFPRPNSNDNLNEVAIYRCVQK